MPLLDFLGLNPSGGYHIDVSKIITSAKGKINSI